MILKTKYCGEIELNLNFKKNIETCVSERRYCDSKIVWAYRIGKNKIFGTRMTYGDCKIFEENRFGKYETFDLAPYWLIKKVQKWEKLNRSYGISQISDGVYDKGHRLMKLGTKFGNWTLVDTVYGRHYDFVHKDGRKVRF